MQEDASHMVAVYFLTEGKIERNTAEQKRTVKQFTSLFLGFSVNCALFYHFWYHDNMSKLFFVKLMQHQML